MSIRGLFFVGFFAVASVLALFRPIWGVAAYVTHYHSFPEGSWWGASLAASGVRFSFTITFFLALGTLLNLRRLPYGRALLAQEYIYLIFLAWMVVIRLIKGQQADEDAVDKMLKMAVFLLSMTHILVTPVQFNRFLGVLVSCALYLGYECYTAPYSMYVDGRLEGVGGPDFVDSNALAAHMVALLPIIGVRFLRGGWKSKLGCFVAGVLIANGVVQTRSRGGFLACLVVIALLPLISPKGYRKRALILIALGAVGSLALVDAKYLERMSTLQAGEREKDESAMSRLRFWRQVSR